MTCIVACRKGDDFILMSDSQSSMKYIKYNVSDAINTKLARAIDDEEAILCHTGSSRDITIIKQIPGLFNSFTEDYPEFNKDYVINVFCPKVRETFFELGLISNVKTHTFPTRLLIAKKNKAFLITPNGAVYSIKNNYFDGSGSVPALGAYSCLYNGYDYFQKSLISLGVACLFDQCCSYPLLLASTKNRNFFVINNEDELMDVVDGRKELDL